MDLLSVKVPFHNEAGFSNMSKNRPTYRAYSRFSRAQSLLSRNADEQLPYQPPPVPLLDLNQSLLRGRGRSKQTADHNALEICVKQHC